MIMQAEHLLSTSPLSERVPDHKTELPKYGTENKQINTVEEEKDPLYTILAPKQPIQQQIDAVMKITAINDEEDVTIALNPPNNSDHLKTTLKKQQRAWVDPYEVAVQDTFYHKSVHTLRPTFDILKKSIQGTVSLNNLFLSNDDLDPDDDDAKNPDDIEVEEADQELEEIAKKGEKRNKFGPWDGVMAGCLLNIFGVIMFLRVGFVVGQAGIIQTLIIMCISTTVTVLTALSMSAICTNGQILAGGAYYIISRALGPSIGGAIGILFSIGNMAACSLYLIGFAETLVINLREFFGFSIFEDDPVMDVRIWSNAVLCFVLFLAIIGLKYVIKAQLGLLIFIVCAILLFFIGSFYKEVYNDEYPNPEPPPDTIQYLVITPKGWFNGNFMENLRSGYEGYDFWGVLSIFFPAVTGIMAGANISGDLRNASSDIPKGTLTAIFISTIVYMVLAIFVGAVTVRYELITNELVMALICVWEPIVLIGIYAATLSSAIASLVGAPRILQAVANDNLFPFKCLKFFAKSNKSGNPIRGYFLSFAFAFCCNLIGELNAIAPLISQFFMLTYLLINFACFALEMSKSPGWRPSFKYFNKWTSGIGATLCLIIMFLLNWIYALIAVFFAFAIYLYIEWRDPDVNWGAAQQARRYYNVYKSVLKLRKKKEMHIKNWRPALLVLISDPIKNSQLMLFAQTLRKSYGPLFYASVHCGFDYRTNINKYHEANSFGYLPAGCPKKSKGFYEVILSETFRSGVQHLLQLVGVGSVRPNTLIIGYKDKWVTQYEGETTQYVQVLRDTLVMGMGLIIINGYKRINWIVDEYSPPALTPHVSMSEPDIFDKTRGSTPIIDTKDHIHNVSPIISEGYKEEELNTFISMGPGPSAWEIGQGKDTVIDVWWMIDDGGLCMLIPYIMKLHKFWSRCRLRMLMVSEQDTVTGDICTMKSLIDNFRLPYEGPILVSARKAPNTKTIQTYESLAKCKLNETPRPSVIQKWLILSELLFEYSRYSGVNVVTLPIPTKAMKPRMYMALLHMLSDQNKLPPTIIMRGNGESTLTFYSE